MASVLKPDQLHSFLNGFHSIIHFNARSLHKRFDIIDGFLTSLSCSFSMIAITETWLSDDDKNLYCFHNFNSEYCNRITSNYGGAAIFVSSGIAYRRRHDLFFTVDNCESVWVEIDNCFLTGDNKNLIFGCVYRSPSSPISDFCTNLDHILHKISIENKNVVIMGDFNINLLDEGSPICINYTSLLHGYGYDCLIDAPTREDFSGSCTLIDHALSNLLDPPEAKVLHIDISDHYPIILRFNTNARPHSFSHTRYVLDKESFKTAVASTNWTEIKSIINPQKAFSKFLSLISTHLMKFTFKTKCKKIIAFSHNPWLSQQLLTVMRKRDNLYRKTKKQPFNKNLSARYKIFCNALNYKLKTAKRLYFEERIQHASSTKKKWEIVNSFLNRNSRQDEVRRIIIDGVEYDSPSEVAEAFSNFFFPDNTNSPTESINTSRLPHSFFLFPTIPDEITDVIRNLKMTSAGIDEIHPANIKSIVHIISDILSFIVNLMFKNGVFPYELKRGKVIPVFKKGDKSLLNNYRPICILPFLGKVVEKLIETRLTKYLSKFNIISSSQFGFRHGYSTEMALIHLTDQIKKLIDEGCLVASIFIDLTKAFDSINHNILFTKLESIGICGPALSLLKSYLHNRVQVVSISNVYSRQRTTNIGVPQGSILGPLLFLIYINDLPKCLSSSQCILYADDTTIFTSHKDISSLVTILNTDLESIFKWCNTNMLSINASKTKFVVFTSHQRNVTSAPNITFGPHSISPCSFSSFLGILLDCNLKYQRHIAHIKKKLAYGIRVLVKTRPYFSRSTLLSLYHSFVHSHFTYGITCWGNTYNTHISSLQIVQNHAIRLITSSPRFSNAKSLLHENNILTLTELTKFNLGIFFYRLLNNQLPPTIFPSSDLVIYSNTRFALNNNFLLPSIRTNYGKQTVKFTSISLWNTLPLNIKSISSFHQFKKQYKLYLLHAD